MGGRHGLHFKVYASTAGAPLLSCTTNEVHRLIREDLDSMGRAKNSRQRSRASFCTADSC
jgi:hypothetical protein